MIAADGRIVWLRDLVTVVVEGDRATRLRGVMVDITKRKRAEEALREQASLLNLTHDTVFVRDMNDVNHLLESRRRGAIRLEKGGGHRAGLSPAHADDLPRAARRDQ